MQNLTEVPGNETSQKSLSVIIKFLDTSRYILFAYMLINDTLQLLSSVLLFLFAMGQPRTLSMLHGFQLLLCVLAFTSPITETLIVLHANWLPEDVVFFNFFCFMLIPCFLSPLIYGFRDQSLRGYIRKTYLCCSDKLKSSC
ncbi:hypothetical protein L3Q82_018669 [Scortum barcoo]|uniref:Uncharacterized protein n=1 Tax=Scortum barcoo TaxID=214431 RepID=A0ACB8VFG3_9TELE|nr:hypothetical protein L3Q82_018669 [Scortum barcoo]